MGSFEYDIFNNPLEHQTVELNSEADIMAYANNAFEGMRYAEDYKPITVEKVQETIEDIIKNMPVDYHRERAIEAGYREYLDANPNIEYAERIAEENSHTNLYPQYVAEQRNISYTEYVAEAVPSGFAVGDTNPRQGLVYAGEYVANITERSLVDKIYVDAMTGLRWADKKYDVEEFFYDSQFEDYKLESR